MNSQGLKFTRLRVVTELFSLVLTVSCATTQTRSTAISLPVVYLPIFASCEPMDQEVQFSMSDQETRIFTGGLVMATQLNGNISVQMNSVLGDTIFETKRSSEHWISSGAMLVSIDETKFGKLIVQGHEIPIQVNELGCLMNGFWPMRWISILNLREESGQEIELYGTDEQRTISLNLKLKMNRDGSQSSNIKSCAVLQWGGIFGFFKRSLQICRNQADQKVDMNLTGFRGYKVNWVIQNEL